MRLLYVALALTIAALVFEVFGNSAAAFGLLAVSQFFLLLLVLRLRRLVLTLARAIGRVHSAR